MIEYLFIIRMAYKTNYRFNNTINNKLTKIKIKKIEKIIN